MPLSQAADHLLWAREHVTYVVEDRESDIVMQIGHGYRRKSQLQIVKKQRTAADWKARKRVARPRLVQPEATMGTSAAHIKAFWQRDQSTTSRNRLRRAEQHCVAEGIFETNTCRTREYPTGAGSVVAEKRVVGRILDQRTAEIGFRAKVTGRHAALERSVTAVIGLQIIVAPVAHKKEIRFAHARRL